MEILYTDIPICDILEDTGIKGSYIIDMEKAGKNVRFKI